LDVLAIQGRFDDLLGYAAQWLKQDSQVDEVYRSVIGLLVRHKKYDPALKLAEEWLARREKIAATAPAVLPAVLEVRVVITEVLLLAERKKEALAAAQAAVKSEPKNPRALRLLVLALRAMEKDDQVLGVLQKILELDPDDPTVNNDLGYTWADQGVNLDRAEAMIRKALAARPDEVAFRDSFAWVLYKQGKFAEARTVFDQVVTAEPERLHSVIFDHAGDVCWRLGQKQEAARLWERAVEFAKKDATPDSDSKKVLAETPRKIEAARKGAEPKVAPLGKGVLEPPTR
jgi:tetratricopeptide (TPR) repeat protein